MPGIPSAPSQVVAGAAERSTLVNSDPGSTLCSAAPSRPLTASPTAKSGCRESRTVPMPKARITSSMPTGGT